MDTRQIKNLISQYDTISFDIFDTLLMRPYFRPEDLFSHIESAHHYGTYNFFLERNQAFGVAIRKNTDPKCEEVTLDQIYDEIRPIELQKYKNIEIDYELKCLKPIDDMIDIFHYCIENKKSVYLISDMYLPQEIIEHILEKNGIKNYKKLYLSSSYKKLKGSGSLFNYIMVQEQLNPERWLHIGDNEHSDSNIPKSLGINALKITALRDEFSKKYPQYINYYNSCPSFTASVIGGMGSYNNRKRNNQDYFTTIGYLYGGPLAISYIQWLDKKSQEDNISDLLFVMRDGYILKKLFDLYSKNRIKTHYVYAPRIFSYVTTLNISDKLQNDYEKNDAIISILKYYKDDLLREIKTFPDLNNPNVCNNYYRANYKVIAGLAKKEEKRYSSYLLNKKYEGKQLGLVDMMTSFFTAQKLIQNILENDFYIHGYYQWVSDTFKVDKSKFLYSQQSFIPYNISFIELLITAPTPHVIGMYGDKPIFASPSKHEKARIEAYRKIENGILLFAKDFNHFFKDFDFQELDFTEILRWHECFRQHPTLQDVREFSHLYHSWDSSHSSYEKIFPNWTIWSMTKAKIRGGCGCLRDHGIISTCKHAIHKLKFFLRQE